MKAKPEKIKFEPIESALSSIQPIFDEYQKECFIERSPQFFSLELCGEAGELANFEKKRWKGVEIKIENFSDEAADVFIALVNYCNSAGIDLGKAVFAKLNEIERRRMASLESAK